MLDIHCHLLPGIDDGACTMEQALELARFASDDGITRMVLTPHIQPGTYDNKAVSIRQVFDQFRQAVSAAAIPLELAMAAEVRICPEILPMIANGEIPMYQSPDGKSSILLEFPHSHIPPGSENMIRWLHSQDIGCVIAHPERNKELMRNIDKLLPYMHMGCELQVTAASVAGKFGVAAQHVASQLLERGWVKILATDAHNIHHRPPALAQGRAAAASLIDSSQADKLVGDGPWMVAGGMFASV